MCDIKVGVRLTQAEVYALLEHFDDSSEIPLRVDLDFDSYSQKLSDHAFFILYYKDDKFLGFLSYYLNPEGRFAFVPQVVVHKEGRHQGIGHLMFAKLEEAIAPRYTSIRLQVLKDNHPALQFYRREGYHILPTSENSSPLPNRHLLCKELGF